MSAGSGPIRVAKKIITDTIQTTTIPKRKRLMMYLFTALHPVRLFSCRFLRSFFKPPLVTHELDVFKGGREPYERLNLVGVPLYPGADGRRRIR